MERRRGGGGKRENMGRGGRGEGELKRRSYGPE